MKTRRLNIILIALLFLASAAAAYLYNDMQHKVDLLNMEKVRIKNILKSRNELRAEHKALVQEVDSLTQLLTQDTIPQAAQ